MNIMLDIIGQAVLATVVWWGFTMLFSTRMSFNIAILLGLPFGLLTLMWCMIEFFEKYS